MNRKKFIKLTGSYAMLFPIVKKLDNISPAKTRQYDKALKMHFIEAFNRFEQVWNFNDFWKRGNTFDACLTFTDALLHKWPDAPEIKSIQQKVNQMLEENFTYFKSFDPGVLWADDFGWWGLMGLNARKHLLRSGNKELADKYLQLSTDLCWQQERDHAYDFSDTAKPVPHGCRNGDANGKNKGAKNTVTNVLFFLLSARIYRLKPAENISDNEKYLEMAYQQWVWFDSWFKLGEYEYLKKTTSGGALVQERPTAFFEGSDYAVTVHPTWEKGWLWTGDQGMLLTALTDMLAIKNNLAAWITKNKIKSEFNADDFEKRIKHYIVLLKKGIKTALINDTDSIIREAPFTSNFGPEFGNDYLAGRGIMMRYLGILDKKNTRLDFQRSIQATADAIWQTRDRLNNQFQPEFTNAENDKLYIQQFKAQWGLADNIFKWQIETMNEQQKFGVCQSIGLDALGAVIHLM
ncbi:MAG TPA: hypothetical protein VMU83_03525 [Hanamia sp.]|nr:hypothetical protein [Hanamia sp.]